MPTTDNSAGPVRQDAPTGGLSMDRSQTSRYTSVSSTTVSLQLIAGTAPSITSPPSSLIQPHGMQLVVQPGTADVGGRRVEGIRMARPAGLASSYGTAYEPGC